MTLECYILSPLKPCGLYMYLQVYTKNCIVDTHHIHAFCTILTVNVFRYSFHCLAFLMEALSVVCDI